MALRKTVWAAVFAGVVLVSARVGGAAVDSMRNMFVINEDDSHFFGTRQPDQMTLAGLQAFIDQYAGTTVTHLFLNPNAQKASYRSDVWEAIWELKGAQQPAREGSSEKLWCENAKLLSERGLDPYTIWIARCREKGIAPWLSMRMNDNHYNSELNCYIHNSFWIEHPEYWRGPNDAFNYAIPEVREHHMKLVREYFERYDPDGLELDWMRFPYHFKPGQEAAGCDILTQFMKDTRALAQEWSVKRGHAIKLAARVPAHPDAARGLGMDGVRWAREGLVDMLIPCPFWSSSDFDIPVEVWRERLGDAAARVTLAPGLEFNSRPWPSGAAVANDLEAARGFAAACRQRGADSLYLFNWMDSETRPVSAEDYARLLYEGLGAEGVQKAPRRHLVCYRDTVPAGFPNGACLPVEGPAGGSFRLHVGPRPTAGKVWAVAGLAQRDGVADASLTGTLNGTALGPAEAVADISRLGGGTVRALKLACPLDAVRAGYNDLTLQQPAGQPAQQVVWVELRIEP
jgi:hypothetical protein